jgi:antirestriction protein
MTTEQSPEPKIYVASLSDYNAGRLHGRWIDAAQDVEAVEAEIVDMLGESRELVAEEWAIHDYDDFGDIRLGEFEDLGHVCELAAALVEYGEAFGAWYVNGGHDDGQPLGEQFQESFCGTFDDLDDYAQDLATGLGEVTDQHLTTWPFYCIDWDRAGRELELGGDIWTAPASLGRIHIFR